MDRTRASDVEREAAVGVLRTAAQEGRLDTDELEERIAAAYAAKTRGELNTLLDDLPPAMAPSVPAPRPPGAIARWRAPVPLDRAMVDLVEFVAPPLQSYGFRIVSRTANELVFARSRRPAWTIALAVFLFPVGLLALLYSEKHSVVLSAAEHGGETIIVAQGNVPPRIRRALMELER